MSPLILVGIGCIIVVLILARGISQMGKGDMESAKRSNNLMKWRIVAQLVVVILVVVLTAFGAGK